MPGQCGRITFDNNTFEKLISGETIFLDVRPDTVKLEISLDKESKYHLTYRDILSAAQKQLKIPASRQI